MRGLSDAGEGFSQQGLEISLWNRQEGRGGVRGHGGKVCGRQSDELVATPFTGECRIEGIGVTLQLNRLA